MFKALKGLGEPDEQHLATLQPKLHQAAVLLDTTLRRTGYVCGDHLALAAYYLAAYPMYARQARINLQPYPDLSRWLERIHSLDEWQAATGARTS